MLGISPDQIAAAEAANERLQRMAEVAGGEAIPPFSREQYLAKARPKPLRPKPYELQSSAVECMKLAEKAGYVNLEIREIKKEAPAVAA